MNSDKVNGVADPETFAFVAGCLYSRGGIGDGGYPARPWFFFHALDKEVMEEARTAFGYMGSITRVQPERGAPSWKFYMYGPPALYALQDLLPYLRGQKKDNARRLLDRWGAIPPPHLAGRNPEYAHTN